MSFKNADSKLSVQASTVRKILEDASEGCEDIDRFFAPKELHQVVWQDAYQRIRDFFQNDYQKAKAFVKECEDRTTQHFVYVLGLSDVLEAFPEFQTDFEMNSGKTFSIVASMDDGTFRSTQRFTDEDKAIKFAKALFNHAGDVYAVAVVSESGISTWWSDVPLDITRELVEIEMVDYQRGMGMTPSEHAYSQSCDPSGLMNE